MTEQKIERIVLDKLEAALSAAGVDGIQMMGAWQVSGNGDLKSLEDGTKMGVVGVKVYPRAYDTPTIPDGKFQVDVSLTVRAEVDGGGNGYMDATAAVSETIHAWQKSFSEYAEDFAIEDEFIPTGFNIESGDIGLDRESCIWQFNQSFTLYGIIK